MNFRALNMRKTTADKTSDRRNQQSELSKIVTRTGDRTF